MRSVMVSICRVHDALNVNALVVLQIPQDIRNPRSPSRGVACSAIGAILPYRPFSSRATAAQRSATYKLSGVFALAGVGLVLHRRPASIFYFQHIRMVLEFFAPKPHFCILSAHRDIGALDI